MQVPFESSETGLLNDVAAQNAYFAQAQNNAGINESSLPFR